MPTAPRASDAPDRIARALSHAIPRPFWTDRADAPSRRAALDDSAEPADLVIIGAGFTGLWSALHAARRYPAKRIVLLESEQVGFGASGRNGGFVSSSLTHGLHHGATMWPNEIARMHAAGKQNLADMIADIQAEGIDCALETVGKISVAVEPWQIAGLHEGQILARQYGDELAWLDEKSMRSTVASPTYLGGLRDPHGTALVDPARLAWGLAAAAERHGVTIAESTRVTRIAETRDGIELSVNSDGRPGMLKTATAILATGAYPSPLRRLSSYIMPLYDHVLVTEPLSASQLDSLGWKNREGLTDAGNQFHYYRLTEDNRIVWGGWDATFHSGPYSDERWRDSPSFPLLAQHFFTTFPQLDDVRFTHRWAGPIDSTTRFTAAYGTAVGGRLAYAVGHTGLGVGAARFSAEVALDLLAGEPTQATSYTMVRRKPFPIPPEPLRTPLVGFMRNEMVRADNNKGRRSMVLRVLNRFGIGFDS